MMSGSEEVVWEWSAVVSWVGLMLRAAFTQLLSLKSLSTWPWPTSISVFNFNFNFNFKPLPSFSPDNTRDDDDDDDDEISSETLPLPDTDTDTDTLERLTVVLDLDETLVCAYETCSLTDSVRSQALHASLTSFQIQFFSSSPSKQVHGKPKINHVTVYQRPGLNHFLHELSKFADLVLFTAALEGYARPLVDKIDVDNRFKLRLYRPATVTTEYREHVKDLTCISKDLSRVVIVDNNPFSFLLQPLNGIPCVPFSPSQPYDDQLLSVLLPLLKELSIHRDVRPLLNCIFQMPDWFQKHGIPQSSSSS